MRQIRVLPVVRKKSQGATHESSKSSTSFEVTWLPFNGSGKNQALFNNLAEKSPFTKPQSQNRLKEVLLESGFSLCAFSLALHQSLQRSGIPSSCISPSSVIDFYKTFSSRDPLCVIGPIPCNVNETPFRDALGVILVLLYCKGVENFYAELPGLPLLLTKDNCLRQFSSKNPKFLSRFQDILPGSPDIFMHELVDQRVFQDALTVKSSVVKPLGLQGFAASLPQTLEVKQYGEGRSVEWFPNQKGIPNQRWITRVWFFLGQLLMDEVLRDPTLPEETKSLQIKAALGPLANWSILPCTESKDRETKKSLFSFFAVRSFPPLTHVLVPLCEATTVLDFGSSDATNRKLLDVLRRLGLPELNHAAISTSLSSKPVELARLMVSSLKVPASLLIALSQKIEKEPHLPQRLDSAERRTILVYFSRSVSSLQDEDRSRLRKLPFYQATHGGFIALGGDRQVCVLPAGIPREDIDKLEHHLRVVFIETGELLSDLFKFLAFECVSAVDLYCTYILPHLGIFDQDTRQTHLEYIRRNILSDLLLSGDEKQRLQECLRNTPIIPTANGTLKTPSFFYDPCVDVFRIMLSESCFPPEPLNSPEWLVILRTIGLIYKVSQELFIQFAREVEDEAVTQRTSKTEQKSKILVKHLMRRTNVVAEGILPVICSISFVASEPVKKPLRDLCQPFNDMGDGQIPFFAFKGAVPSTYAEVVWTKAHLLPWSADPNNCRSELGCPPGKSIEKYCNAFSAQLQIARKPSVDLVVRHCQTVCCLHENKEGKEIRFEQRARLREVMERIYDFLQASPIAVKDSKDLLENTPCIIVEQGKKFILPRQAVLELYEHLEIKPFLYSVPREFGKFHPLFHTLGCSMHVTIVHYAMVLEMLHVKANNEKLHPNEVIICVRALQGFFQRLEENEEDLSSISQLYFPGMSTRGNFLEEVDVGTPVTLRESSQLVFNDASFSILDRLQNFSHLLLDLRSMKVTCSSSITNYKELVMKLPTKLRPKMLSSLVEEKLSSRNDSTLSSDAVNSLRNQLSSPHFIAAVVRLIRDENRGKKDIDKAIIANIKRRLQGIDIRVVVNLKSILFCDGSPIPESEKEVPYFLEKSIVSAEEKWTVYLNSVTGIEEGFTIISLVSNVIVELYGNLLGKRAVLIPHLLISVPSDIGTLLDAAGVCQDDSLFAMKVEIFPTLGTFIPLIDHHLLNDAFVEFEPGEYVGYELEDPSINRTEGVATYIYARVVQEVTEKCLPLLTKKYRIDVGCGEDLVVDAVDLYKFHRLPTAPSTTLAVFKNGERSTPERSKSRSQQEVFDEISDQLEDAWRLQEEKRRKIIKRLYLQWHPDKNVGDEEFCNEVCKHIQSEILQLERGEPRGSQESSNVSSSQSQHGFYEDFFRSWGARAREHHTQREGYRSRQQFPRNSARAKNPQPGEAKRWFKQAEADIAATENDIIYRRPSYEWACFKCHQAAEKALKAAQYAIDVERTNVHNLLHICHELDDSELAQLASQLECLVGNSTRMRYPDRVRFPQIPNDVYSADMAEEALRLAKKVVQRVKNRLT